MTILDQRAALERLIARDRVDYAAISRLIGRNPAYIHQFLHRGSPKKLAEADRRTLARYFGVDERSLGGPDDATGTGGTGDLIMIPRLGVGASAGSGNINEDEQIVSRISFDRTWLRRLVPAKPESLSIIRVEGDSMAPTLSDGDEIMVNTEDAAGRLREGIYVLRRDDALVVKRVAVNPATHRISVRSDNPAYPTWPDCRPDEVAVIGRVAWMSRKIV